MDKRLYLLLMDNYEYSSYETPVVKLTMKKAEKEYRKALRRRHSSETMEETIRGNIRKACELADLHDSVLYRNLYTQQRFYPGISPDSVF